MAKALFGSVGGPVPAQAAQFATLRRRIDDLEAEVLRLNAENDRLRAAVSDRGRTPVDLDTVDLDAGELLEPLTR